MRKKIAIIVAALFLFMVFVLTKSGEEAEIFAKSHLLAQLLYTQNERFLAEGASSLINADAAKSVSGLREVQFAMKKGELIFPISMRGKSLSVADGEGIERNGKMWIHVVPFPNGIIKLVWNSKGNPWTIWFFLCALVLFPIIYFLKRNKWFKRKNAEDEKTDVCERIHSEVFSRDELIGVVEKVFGGKAYLFSSSLRLEAGEDLDSHLLDMIRPEEAGGMIEALGVAEKTGVFSGERMWQGIERNIKIVLLEDKSFLVALN